MFFNCLIAGLWNYLQDDKMNPSALAACTQEFVNTRRIWPEISQIRVLSPVSWWGVKPEPDVAPIRFTDTWHWTQERHIANAVALRNLRASGKSDLLEIGSGFGGLAERLARRDDIDPSVLVDIPLNLVTAFFYLRRSLPNTPVTLYSRPKEVITAQTTGQTGIYLIPSCFFTGLHDWQNLSVVANFGSFSEMDSETVAFYLARLPKSYKILVEAISNSTTLNESGHRQVCVDNFGYPPGAVRIFESPFSSLPLGNRYKIVVNVLNTE